jgi:hypothetical protein
MTVGCRRVNPVCASSLCCHSVYFREISFFGFSSKLASLKKEPFHKKSNHLLKSWRPKNIVVWTYWWLCFDLAPARSLRSISSSMQEDEFQIFNAD